MTLTKVQSGFIDLTTSAGLTVGAGSASTPALNFGDSTTGIFKPATNEVAIALSGSQQFTFKNNNFGIGTNSPDVPLVVVGNTKISGNTHIGSPSGSSARLAVYRATQYASNPVFEAYSNITGNSQTKIFLVDGNGKVGIGTDNPVGKLDVRFDGTGSIIQTWRSDLGTNDRNIILKAPSSDSASEPFTFQTGNSIAFQIDATEALRIDSSGKLSVGFAGLDVAGALIQESSAQGCSLLMHRDDTTVINDDSLGLIRFYSNAGSSNQEHARISGLCDGTAGANDKPGRLTFYTTADGASSPTERVRITSEGKLFIDRTHASATTGDHPALDIDTYANGTAGATFATGIDFRIAGVHKKRLAITNADSSVGTGDWVFYRDNGSNEALRITSGGDVNISDGNLVLATGRGISFVNAADTATGETVTASVLDDYEAGTYTPTLSFGDGNTGITYGNNNGGSYTKIGRLVYVHVRIEITSKGSSTGAAKVRNLPFVIGNHQSGSSSVEGSVAIGGYQQNCFITTTSTNTSAGCKLMVGTSEVTLMHNNYSTGTSSNMSHSSFVNNSSFAFDLVYLAA